jgi:hypothetical protein
MSSTMRSQPSALAPESVGKVSAETFSIRLIGGFIMAQVLAFGEVLEAADHLSRDEQEELIGILHRRLAQAARQRLAAETQDARQEFAAGHCLPATPDELMCEIMK